MRFLTAGESHGPKLTAIIEGVPAGLMLSVEDINLQLVRRQKGYGRGNRMKIETDKVEITSGVRHGKTLGSPITLVVENKDWVNWQKIMSVEPVAEDDIAKRAFTRPRPGHADIAGGIKYGHRDLRNVLERASARETTMRVVIGAVAQKVLKEIGVEVYSFVREIGEIKQDPHVELDIVEGAALAENSPVRCIDPFAEQKMIAAIDQAKKNGDTLGGIFEIIATGMPVGIGSYVHFDRKLDAKIAAAVMSIQAIKGVGFGLGFEMGRLHGSQVQDEITWESKTGIERKTNKLGGMEGGMTTGMPISLHAVMKPISTLYKPLHSIDIDTKESSLATVERSDTCAVPAAAVIAENVVAWELAVAVVEQFYSDTMETLKASVAAQRQYAREY